MCYSGDLCFTWCVEHSLRLFVMRTVNSEYQTSGETPPPSTDYGYSWGEVLLHRPNDRSVIKLGERRAKGGSALGYTDPTGLTSEP